MAVVALSNGNTRREDMEGAYGGVNIGAGAGGGTEPDFYYEGIQSWSRQVTNVVARGFSVGITAIDVTGAANRVMMFKGQITNYQAINSAAYNIFIGDGVAGTDAFRYIIADDGTILEAVGGVALLVYPIKGGWQIIPIDPNVTAWYDAILGTTPTLTAIDEIGHAVGVASSAKGENIIMDAIDFSEGLWLVGGTSTDPDGMWQDFVDYDEGEGGVAANGDRIGHVSTIEGILYVFGQFTIGETQGGINTDTVFSDFLRTVVFPGGRVGAGWNSVECELAQSNTIITHSNFTFIGQGRDNLKHFFDSSADQVDDTNEEFDIIDHGYFTGDAVLYSNEGGTQITGLTDGIEYFIRTLTADTFSLHSTRVDAFNDTNRMAITAAGTGESHSFRRQPDTRPDFNHRGTLGSADWNSCVWVNCRNFVGTSAVTFISCVLVGCSNMNLVGARLVGSTISDFLLAEGEAAVKTNDLADILACMFIRTAGPTQLGHAIEIDTAGTYGFSGNNFFGYGPKKASFHSQTGVDDSTEVITTDEAHGFVDGDAVYYGDEGGTPVGGLVDGSRYYVNQISTTTLSLHVTRADAVADANRVDLTDGAVAETHYLYSAHSSILNSSGGLVTINVQPGGGTPTIRNTPGSTTVVNNTVTLTVNVKFGQIPVVGARVRIEKQSDGSLISNGETNGSGVYEDTTYNYVSDIPVKVIVRLKGFKYFATLSTILSTGMIVGASLTPDGTVNLP